MNAKYDKEKTHKWICGKCKKEHTGYKTSADCCLPKIRLKNNKTGKEIVLAFGVKRMGYSNECVICDAFGYDRGLATESNNPENWEIVSIEGRR